jgi:dolichol-phosphate mannosyltransferase
MPMETKLISVVIPVLNEAECLPRLYEELTRVCDPLPYRFEFLFVDDGSTDATPAALAAARRRDGRVLYLSLSRNFGHQAALTAGLAHAAGDAVIMMDGDLQHPPALIPELLARFEDGYDVVNTLRQETAAVSPAKRLYSRLFYRLFNWAASVHIEPGGADFRLLSRAAVDALNGLPEVHRFLRGLVPWIGYRQTAVTFRAPDRWAGRPKYTFWRSLKLAVEGITSFSFYPLRKLAVFGSLVALASFLYGAYALYMHLFARSTVPGWTSLLVTVLFMGGCHLLAAGVLGEYLGRVVEQVKNRPVYLVRAAGGVRPAAAPRRPLPEGMITAADAERPARQAG